jgi:hypothetical protein
MKKWIVLWVHGGRIASFPLTINNFDILSRTFYLSLEQQDASGTVHYNVLADKKLTKKELLELNSQMDYEHPAELDLTPA